MPPCGDAVGYVLERFVNSDHDFPPLDPCKTGFQLSKVNKSKIGTEIEQKDMTKTFGSSGNSTGDAHIFLDIFSQIWDQYLFYYTVPSHG